jgi:hypothetical protein
LILFWIFSRCVVNLLCFLLAEAGGNVFPSPGTSVSFHRDVKTTFGIELALFCEQVRVSEILGVISEKLPCGSKSDKVYIEATVHCESSIL